MPCCLHIDPELGELGLESLSWSSLMGWLLCVSQTSALLLLHYGTTSVSSLCGDHLDALSSVAPVSYPIASLRLVQAYLPAKMHTLGGRLNQEVTALYMAGAEGGRHQSNHVGVLPVALGAASPLSCGKSYFG